MNPSISKERLRSHFLEARRRMSFEEVYGLSTRVQKRFLSSGLYRSCRRLALYSSFRNEVLTDEVFRKAEGDGKEVYYPRVMGRGSGHIAFFRVEDLSELSPGSYEIPEPGEKEVRFAPDFFDLVVVPGIAFDLRGARIGYGKGYYDRALKGLDTRVVALAYEFQVALGDIPCEDHDVRVSAIVTEKRVIRVWKGGRTGGEGPGEER